MDINELIDQLEQTLEPAFDESEDYGLWDMKTSQMRLPLDYPAPMFLRRQAD